MGMKKAVDLITSLRALAGCAGIKASRIEDNYRLGEILRHLYGLPDRVFDFPSHDDYLRWLRQEISSLGVNERRERSVKNLPTIDRKYISSAPRNVARLSIGKSGEVPPPKELRKKIRKFAETIR